MFEVNDILVDNNITVSGILIVSGQLVLGAGGTDITTAIGLNSTAIATLSGNLIASGQIPVAVIRGGTGQSTASGAIKSLSPTTTKGDILVDNGTIITRMAAGSSGSVLVTNPNNSGGVQWNAIDAQTATTINVTTTSTSFTDLTSGTITTAAGSYPRQYIINFSGHFAGSNNGNRLNYQLLIDGNAIPGTIRGATINSANFQHNVAIDYTALIYPSTVVKVQWSTTANTATCHNSNLTVFGI